jgi:gamma-glutamyltranspeptidase/glutathione hydrolase
LFTLEDLATWRVKLEEPVRTTYRGIEVDKLTTWTQGPALLEALNLLEGSDLKGMGYNSARYINTVAQAMHLAFADRDFYYGDPAFPPAEPVAGLLSKEYARKRGAAIDGASPRPDARPGDPYPFQGGANPFRDLLDSWPPKPEEGHAAVMPFDEAFRAGTTSVLAADAEGWVVSMTPSGAWVPAVVAGKTGIGLSQRMQSFVVDRRENPFNVVEPGKRPRVTLTPTPLRTAAALAFAVGGHAGPEPPAVLPRRRRIRLRRPGGGGGGELHDLSDGELVRRSLETTGPPDPRPPNPRLGAGRAPQVGLHTRLRRA